MDKHARACGGCSVGVNVSVIISLGIYSRDDGTGPQQPAAHHYGNRTSGAPSRCGSRLETSLEKIESGNENTCEFLQLSDRGTGTKSVSVCFVIYSDIFNWILRG